MPLNILLPKNIFQVEYIALHQEFSKSEALSLYSI